MMKNIVRDYERESKDVMDRKYNYDFDSIIRRYMMRTFEPLLPQGKALELGCYKGESTNVLAEYFKDLTVIEAADNLIAETKANVRKDITFIHSTFESAQLKDKYDAIFLVHTLEHLDDRIGVLEKINSWLSTTGKLFLVVPNANAPSRQIAVKMGLISHNAAVTEAEFKHGHRITYTFDTLEKDALEGKLCIIQRGGVFFKPLANFQFDKMLQTNIIDKHYLEGCYKLGMQYPDLCSSIYLVCGKSEL